MVLSVLSVLATSAMAGCSQESDGGSSAVSHPKPAPSATPSKGLAHPIGLTRRVADGDCSNRTAVGINTEEWTTHAARAGNDFPGLAAAMLADGNTLAIASGAPTPATATAVEFHSGCALNTSFGDHGAVELSLPRVGVGISNVMPLAGGGALIAGATHPAGSRSHWLVGKLTRHGKLNSRFGKRGWTTLRRGYAATAMALARNGDIVVGGDGNGNSYVTEITSKGSPVKSFGASGTVRMPTFGDGGIVGVWIEPGGDVLALLSGGNNGCWGVIAVTLTPHGRRVPGFTAQFRRSLKQADPNPKYPSSTIFVGDITVTAGGFHLVGTAQNNCVDNPPGVNPTQRVSDLAFNNDGTLDTTFGTDGASSFPGPFADSAQLFQARRHHVLLATLPYRTYLSHRLATVKLYRLNTDGDLAQVRGGHHGTTVRMPYRGESNALRGVDATTVSNGRRAAIVANTRRRNAVIVLPAGTAVHGQDDDGRLVAGDLMAG